MKFKQTLLDGWGIAQGHAGVLEQDAGWLCKAVRWPQNKLRCK